MRCGTGGVLTTVCGFTLGEGRPRSRSREVFCLSGEREAENEAVCVREGDVLFGRLPTERLEGPQGQMPDEEVGGGGCGCIVSYAVIYFLYPFLVNVNRIRISMRTEVPETVRDCF
jgi:hypothetical protein